MLNTHKWGPLIGLKGGMDPVREVLQQDFRDSAWQFVTAANGGLALGIVAGSVGTITVHSPEGKDFVLSYGGLGAGAGESFKLPRLGKVNIKIKGESVGGTGGPEAFPNVGGILVADSIVGRDLTRSDFSGPCVFIEGSVGVVASASCTGMLFGVSKLLLLRTLTNREDPRQLLKSARGALVMAGLSAGLQFGGGVAGYIGVII